MYKQTSILSFRNSRSILKLKSQRLDLRVFVLDELDRKYHIDLESLRLKF